MNEYTKQANNFLLKTNTILTIKYIDHDLYFPEDTQSRDIFYFILKRGNKKYASKFGQSIANTGTTPNAYDILACLTKYDPGTFENFCSDYGYETDSRTSMRTYKAVLKEWKGISNLFTEEELQELCEIN